MFTALCIIARCIDLKINLIVFIVIQKIKSFMWHKVMEYIDKRRA